MSNNNGDQKLQNFNINNFYKALPKRRIELINGQLVISGSLGRSAMVMASIIQSYGPSILRRIVPADLLSNALIAVFKTTTSPVPTADFSPSPYSYPLGRLAAEIRLALFKTPGLAVMGGGTVVKLGDNGFMPDVYVLGSQRKHRLYNYFLDGAPDLIMEVITPELLAHEKEVRLPAFADAGVREVWWIDPVEKTFAPMVLRAGKYTVVGWEGNWYNCRSLPNLAIQPGRLFLNDKLWMQIPEDLFKIKVAATELPQVPSPPTTLGDYPWPWFAFQPRLDVDPIAISFPEYVVGNWEAKFEWLHGKAIFGGSEETTLELLGLLLMTLGVREGISCTDQADW